MPRKPPRGSIYKVTARAKDGRIVHSQTFLEDVDLDQAKQSVEKYVRRNGYSAPLDVTAESFNED